MKNKRKYLVLLIPVIAGLLTCNNAYSQSDSTLLTSMSLEELLKVKVTTASKTLQEIDLAPATILVITKEQIKMRGYQSLLDLMTDLPDVKIDDKIYSGSRNSIVMRGIQGQQNFFVLLDGIKISSPTNEALPIMENYPVHLAEQVEVVFGPASALYGADAVAGVINIITKKVSSSKDLEVDVSSAAGMYGYFNNSLYLAKKLDSRSSLVVSGQYCVDKQPDLSKIYKDDTLLSIAHYGNGGTFNTIFGPMTPNAPVTPKYEAPTAAYNFYAALHINEFTLSAFTNYTKLPTAWGSNTHNTVYNKEVYMGQSVSGFAANYKKTMKEVTSTSTLSASYYAMDPESNYRNLYTAMEPAYKFATTLAIKMEQQVDYRVSRKINLTAGGTHETFSTTPQSTDLEVPVNLRSNIAGSYLGTKAYYRPEGLPAQFYNVLYHNEGAYVQLQYALARKFNFTLGSRYDYNSRYGKTFNPRLGVVYKATAHTTIKAMYGSAYLAPPPSTAYVTYGSFTTADSGKTYSSAFLHLPNPELGPTRSQTAELNVRHYFTRNFVVKLDGYYTRTTGLFAFADDALSARRYNNTFLGHPVGYVEVFVNDGIQRNYGGSLALNLKHSVGNVFLNSYASASYMDGNKSKTGNAYKTELPFISHFMMRIGTDIRAGNFTCSPRLLLVSPQHLPGTADTTGTLIKAQDIPGYALLNISARYEFGKRLSVFANVHNALNRRYRAVGFNMDLNNKNTDLLYGQPQDPIRVTGGINLTF